MTRIDPFLDKSPAVAIPEPEYTTFIEDFIRITLNKYRDLIKSPLCEVLARCDAVWWVAEAEGHPGFYGAEVPARWFHDIHQAVRTCQIFLPQLGIYWPAISVSTRLSEPLPTPLQTLEEQYSSSHEGIGIQRSQCRCPLSCSVDPNRRDAPRIENASP